MCFLFAFSIYDKRKSDAGENGIAMQHFPPPPLFFFFFCNVAFEPGQGTVPIMLKVGIYSDMRCDLAGGQELEQKSGIAA